MRLDPEAATGAETPTPVSDGEFSALMGALGPFSDHPRLAVAVSGGPDSMALALLVQNWVSERGGSLLTLTVDHGLRPEAAAEAVATGRQLAGRGIQHLIAVWRPESPDRVGQAEARRARYDLLARVALSRGYCTLLTAHHQGDQAETLLQRLDHGSGPAGLAAMAPSSLRRGLCLMRPLLSVSKERLEATCRAAGLKVVRDPTNDDQAHERPVLRARLAEGGQGPRRTRALAAAAGRARRGARRIEAEATRAALACFRLRAPGYAWVDADGLAALAPLAAERAVGRLVSAIGGGDYLRGEGLESFTAWLAGGAGPESGRTFGRVHARRARDGHGKPAILMCREAVEGAELPVTAASVLLWDDRFLADLRPVGLIGGRLAPLGVELGNRLKDVWGCPGDAARTLPGLWSAGELVALPQFSFHDRLESAGSLAVFECQWAPRHPVTASGQSLANVDKGRQGVEILPQTT